MGESESRGQSSSSGGGTRTLQTRPDIKNMTYRDRVALLLEYMKGRPINEKCSFSLRKAFNKIKYPYYKMVFHKIGKYVDIERGVYVEYANNIVLGNNVSIDKNAILVGSSRKYKPNIVIGNYTIIGQFVILNTYEGYIKIGRNCAIEPFCTLFGHGGLDIGNFVIIAPKTTIIPANHGFKDIGIPMLRQHHTAEGIKIEDNVWIGTNVSILDGVTIGTGSIIGAGSVVTESIPEYSIAVGVPAKVIKKREQIVETENVS